MNKRYKKNKMGANAGHSKLILKNMAVSLIAHESIETSKPKSRQIKSYIEKLITKAKKNKENAEKVIFEQIRNERAAKKLVEVLVPRMDNRNSGYVRAIKSGFRKGNSEETYVVSFVDFTPKDKRAKKRSQASSKKSTNSKSGDNGIVNRVKNLGRNNQEDTSKAQVKSDETQAKSRSGI